ncbi:MAG: radical SAM protein [Candidatus Acidoferrales bacterium]
MAQALKMLTARRPQVEKVTKPLNIDRHPFEDYLSNTYMRKFLGLLTQKGADGQCYLEKLFTTYDSPDLSVVDKLKYGLPHQAIEIFRRKAGVSKDVIKAKVFHHIPTVRSLVNTAKSIATYGLTTPQRFAAPLIVVWNITQACNLTCKHCYQDATHKPLADELTWEEKERVLDELADSYVPFIAFAGGEPLVCKDIWKVLEHCKKRSIHVTVATNGTMLTKDVCQRLVEVGVKYVEVSLDSIDPDEHDSFRGLRGAWKRSTQGIRNIAATPGLRAGVATCFTRQNVHTADDMINLAKDLGCTSFVHFNFIPVGRGKEIAQYDLTPAQRENLLRTLNRFLQEGEISIMSTAPQFGRACIVYGSEEGLMATGHAGSGRGKETKVLAKYIGGCGAGRCYCSIQPNGRVNPCVYIPSHEVGDLRKSHFLDIWNNSLFDLLSDRDDRGDHCGICDYRHYCGGCRARAVSYLGDIQAGDPGCVYNIHAWDEVTAGQKKGLAVLGQDAFPDNFLASMTDGKLPSQQKAPDVLLSQLSTVLDDVVGQPGAAAQGDD